MSKTRGDITEGTELACLIGYIAELTRVAMERFTTEDISAEEALDRAIMEWQESNARADSKEE